MKEMLAALMLTLSVGVSLPGNVMDIEETADIKNSTVGIVANEKWFGGNCIGSGVIFSNAPDHVTILTAAHVVRHTEEICTIVFDEEHTTQGTTYYISDDADVAFISVPPDSLPVSYHCASVDEKAYDDLAIGDPVTYGAKIYFSEVINPNMERLTLDSFSRTHTVTDKWCYDDFCNDYMLVAHGGSTHDTGVTLRGMSGGGAYDSEGNLVGILVAGDGNTTTSYAVPLPTILSEYDKAIAIKEKERGV